jgi:hypothetical protein
MASEIISHFASASSEKFSSAIIAGYIFILSCLPQLQAQSPLQYGIHSLLFTGCS